MRRLAAALAAVAVAAGVAATVGAAPGTAGEPTPVTLLVAGSTGASVYLVDERRGVQGRIRVGPAPHGVALAPGGRAFVATATGVAIVDARRLVRTGFVRYRAAVGPPSTGEYRAGGMGIASSPDGRYAYVGVHLSTGRGRLEIVDTRRLRVVGSVRVGIRPFEVLASRDGRFAYSVDHDSYTVTVVDLRTRRARTISAAPLGRGAYDKPHYATLDGAGRLLLPYQGRVLLRLDPRSGRTTRTRLSAETHQHGIALAGGTRAVIVGTGPAGDVDGPTSVSVVDLRTGAERVSPLRRAHERVAVSPDGATAYLTGGYLLETGAWEGVSVVDVASGEVVRELRVPQRPLGLVVLPPGVSAP
ncbi:MAG: YncE family protein [Gaiella sp.]